MDTALQNLDRFVRAVHRRAVALRVVERAGVGLAVGAGFAMVLLPVLMCRGQPAMALSVAALSAGAVAGALSALHRRPTPADAAALVDRQLRLDDLVSTAWALRGRSDADDPWAGTILAIAAARCAALNPSALVLHRLNARGWGGIALAAALVLTAGLLSTSPSATPAVASPFAEGGTVTPTRDRAARPVASSPASRARPAGTDVDETSTMDGANDAASATTDGNAPPPDGVPHARAGDATGPGARGAGAARTDVRNQPPDPDAIPNGGGNDASITGRLAAGGGAAPGEAASGRDASGGAGAARSPARAAAAAAAPPPWSAESWDADRSRADSAIRDGRVPDARRDLVRDYFDHE